MRSEKGGGWTPELVDRALAATRVTAAGALDRTISQRVVDAETATVGEGRLLASGPRRGTKRIVSASITARDIETQLAKRRATDKMRPTLETLRDALASFAASTYGRDESNRDAHLDEALDAASRAASSVRRRHMFPMTLLKRWSASPMERQA